MTELKPCPFCGPGGSIVSVTEEDGYWRIRCGACGSSSGMLPSKKSPSAVAFHHISKYTVDDLLEDYRNGLNLDNLERIIANWNKRPMEVA